MKRLLKNISSMILKIYILMFAMISSVSVAFASRVNRFDSESLKPITDMVNTYAQYFAVFITFMALGAFVFNIIKMGAAGGNSSKREEAIRGLMISGAVAMLVPLSSSIVFFLLKI